MALTMYVPGLTCRHAVRVVSARLRDVPGVLSVEVDGPAGRVVVNGRSSRSETQLRQASTRLSRQAANPTRTTA